MKSSELLDRLATMYQYERDPRRASALLDGALRWWCPMLAQQDRHHEDIAQGGYNGTR